MPPSLGGSPCDKPVKMVTAHVTEETSLSSDSSSGLTAKSPKSTKTPACILLTGATGFLGKVVLEELFRRSKFKSGIEFNKVILVTRPKKDRDPKTRFLQELIQSPCFSRLPKEWVDSVQVVEGDLREDHCGIDGVIYEKLCAQVTHIIHCAGAVNFQNPIAEAASSNITAPLNIYELATRCKHLRKLVVTSTAYTMPATTKPIYEELVPLPIPASQLYQEIQEGKWTDKGILRLTGYNNTYNLSKCIAEHLLLDHPIEIPITIVRPSIIAGASKYPAPGWVDSIMGLAPLIIALGSGLMKTLDSNPLETLDVVPVDMVANQIINEALLIERDYDFKSPIVFAVATLENAWQIERSAHIAVNFFNSQPGRKMRARVPHFGPRDIHYHWHDFFCHKLRLGFYKKCLDLAGDKKMARKINGVSRIIAGVNGNFPYFFHNTFDFITDGTPIGFSGDEQKELIERVAGGVDKYLVNRSKTL